MTRKEMVALLRRLIADEQAAGYTEGGNLEQPEGTQELLNYLDRAVDEYSRRQASAKDIRLMKEMTLRNGITLPLDFLGFCGAVPVSVSGKVIRYYGYEVNVPARYFARLPYVTSFSEDADLPYDPDQSITIAALGAIYALNKHEYNVSQDLALLGYGVTQNGDAEQQAQ